MKLLCGQMATDWIEPGDRHNVFFLLVSVHFCMFERFPLSHTCTHKIKCINKKRVWALDSNCLSFKIGSRLS